MEIIYRRVDLQNEVEMLDIATSDMAIPAKFDSMFEVNEKTIKERLEQLKKCKDDDFFDVAVTTEGLIVGYHVLNKFTSPHGLLAASIQTLWVCKDFRNQGIAKTLKDRGELWAKNNKINHISTFVHKDNVAMKNLNDELGYELVGYKMRKNIK